MESLDRIKDQQSLISLKKSWSDIKHFGWNEFDSPDVKDSGLLMNIEFVKILDKLRDLCKFPFFVNSGFRTADHNATLKGSVNDSAHSSGIATDIRVDNSHERLLIVKFALIVDIRRIGVAKTFIHLDMDFTKPQEVLWLYP